MAHFRTFPRFYAANAVFGWLRMASIGVVSSRSSLSVAWAPRPSTRGHRLEATANDVLAKIGEP
jgi:hypothetical protein